MTITPGKYPDWKAPAKEAETLIWPAPAQILADAIENHRQANAFIQNVPLAQVRRQMRKIAGISGDELALFSGHQVELYHPGVWAKDALTTAAAGTLKGAQAWHLAVDTDHPKHLDLRWPTGSAPITDDPQLPKAHWTGLLAGPTPGYLQQLQSNFSAAAAKWDFVPGAIEILQLLQKSTLTEEITTFDHSIGLSEKFLFLSPLLNSEPYLLLVSHLLARSSEVAHQYNAALAQFRRAQGIRSTTRPMPDMSVSPEQCE